MSVIEVGRIDTFDVDEHFEAMSPWVVRVAQRSPGGFAAGSILSAPGGATSSSVTVARFAAAGAAAARLECAARNLPPSPPPVRAR